MKKVLIGIALWLLAINVGCLLAQDQQKTVDQNAQPNSWRSSGDLFLNLYPISKKTAFIRGQLPYQRWSAGWHLKLEHSKKIELNLLATVIGGTPFDNPERFDYSILAKFNTTRVFSFLWGLDASYNINQEPVPDPTGRIPNTGLSQMFAGLQLTKQKNVNRWLIKNDTHFTKNLRGNIPIFNNDFRGPYVGWRLGNNFTATSRFNNDRWKFMFDSYLEGSSKGPWGDLGAIGATAKLERRFGRHFTWQSGATINRNLGEKPNHPGYTPPQNKPVISLAPLGRDVFTVWLGPRFTF